MDEERWEYRIEHLGGLFRSAMIEHRMELLLNRRSSEGWELASMHQSWLTRRFTVTLRRRRKESALSVP